MKDNICSENAMLFITVSKTERMPYEIFWRAKCAFLLSEIYANLKRDCVAVYLRLRVSFLSFESVKIYKNANCEDQFTFCKTAQDANVSP